jgi:hypothetical protein
VNVIFFQKMLCSKFVGNGGGDDDDDDDGNNFPLK